MNVLNRSTDQVVYSLPELHTRRVFAPGENKEIDAEELRALSQIDGGYILLKEYLRVDDRGWVEENLPNAPIEYFWGADEVRTCILSDSAELFSETLDYAPEGVLDMIKDFSWKIPMTDMNKIHALLEKTGFDVLAAIEVMKPKDGEVQQKPRQRERLRREEA